MVTDQPESTVSEDAIVMEIELAASPERVFRALTDPQQLVSWWGEHGTCTSTQWELDLRVGGKWRAKGKDESCGNWETEGEVLEVDPPRVLAYTWREHLERERGLTQTIVRYDLERTDKGTRLHLTHKGFAGHHAAFEDYRRGWPNVLDMLRAYAEA